MKVLKRLSDYISVIVSNKIPVIDTRAEEYRMKELIETLEKDFREEVYKLKLKFLDECEEKHPELKTLIRDADYSTDLYKTYGSVFAKNIQNAEKSSYMLRRTVQERVILQIELSDKDLTLDDVDTIIFAEIEKALESGSAKESTIDSSTK